MQVITEMFSGIIEAFSLCWTNDRSFSTVEMHHSVSYSMEELRTKGGTWAARTSRSRNVPNLCVGTSLMVRILYVLIVLRGFKWCQFFE